MCETAVARRRGGGGARAAPARATRRATRLVARAS